MLDFRELPRDGVRFELLLREIFLRQGVRPRWTGRGADSGRDLLIEETLRGKIQNTSRRWLIDCKHFAHSEKAVGVADVVDIRDRCERVKAHGFLLACSTTISSELARKLQEISSEATITTEVWDAVTLEAKLLTPHSYSLAQQFFPRSLERPSWQIFQSEQENRWSAHYRGHFMYLESRAGMHPPSLHDIEIIISNMEYVEVGADEKLGIRSIWHDTPNGPFYEVAIDYLVPSESAPKKSPTEIWKQLDEYCINGGTVTWYVNLQITIPQSDYYSQNDPMYYTKFRQPLEKAFDELADIGTMGEVGKWTAVRSPLIRTFADQAIWNANKHNFGFKQMGGLEIIQT